MSAGMRVYAHIIDIDPSVAEYTEVVRLQPTWTIGDITQRFIKNYRARYPSYAWVVSAGLIAKDSTNNTLGPSKVAMNVLEDRADIFFRPAKPLAELRVAAVSSVGSSAAAAAAIPIPVLTEADKVVLRTTVYQSLQAALDMQSKRRNRRARLIYEELLGALEPMKHLHAHDQIAAVLQQCEQQLAEIHLENGRADQAAEHALRALAIAEPRRGRKRQDPDVKELTQVTPGNDDKSFLALLMLLGRVEMAREDFDQANEYFERALALIKEKPSLLSTRERHDLMVWNARALYGSTDIRKRRTCVRIYEGMLKETDSHLGFLAFYSNLAVEGGQWQQTIPFLLRGVVYAAQAKDLSPLDKEAKELLESNMARVSQEPGGIDQLIRDIGAGATPPALSFLAQVVKDQGAIYPSIDLYNRAVKLQRTELGARLATLASTDTNLVAWDLLSRFTNLALSQVHTQEVTYDYRSAFRSLRDFLKEFGHLKIDNVPVSSVYELIKGIDDPSDVRLKQGTHPGAAPWTNMPEIFDAGFVMVDVPKDVISSDYFSEDEQGRPLPKPSLAEAASAPKEREKSAEEREREEKEKERQRQQDAKYPPKRPLNAVELNLLALCFTAVKVLFVCGGLQPIPAICNLLEPVRQGRQLHTTVIRNEHAYYSSIAQLMEKANFPIVPADRKDERVAIYVCGDSHCLSSAWHEIKVERLDSKDGKPIVAMLTPKLVTGLKCWHLRPECKFFPKKNFEFCVRTIPEKATVIFNFGEIDCREGILYAVDKDRYSSVEEGIRVSVGHYMNALEELAKRKKLRVYVHPVVPVLDITRRTVKAFNRILKARVKQSKLLKWLDFFQDLLTPSGDFNMDYAMDGTHMSPSYVPLLERALNQARREAAAASSGASSA